MKIDDNKIDEGVLALPLLCFWKDDGQDDLDADDDKGGPNSSSLSEARRNFRTFGACDESAKQSVREPNPDEMPRKSQTRACRPDQRQLI